MRRVLNFVLFFFILLLVSCKTSSRLVNTSHLEHLYEEINVENKALGTIWIYCESPDFNLVADSDEGFTCVDDVARALIVYCREMRIHPSRVNLHKIKTLANFLIHMKSENGYFYNFMFHDGSINKLHQNSVPIAAFWTWRAYWAFSEVLLVDHEELVELHSQCDSIMKGVEGKISSLCDDHQKSINFDGINMNGCIGKIGSDQMAEMLKGLSNRYLSKPSPELHQLIQSIGGMILTTQNGNVEQVPHFAFLSWQNYWHAWGNSQAYALLMAGQAVHNQTFISSALLEVDHFYRFCLDQKYIAGFKLIKGTDGKLQMMENQKYSQIAYGISPMILATIEAWNITHDRKYATLALDLASWFFGNNEANVKAYDSQSGRCIDGITSKEDHNKNSGAESTIECLLSMQAVEKLGVEKLLYKNFRMRYLSNNLVPQK